MNNYADATVDPDEVEYYHRLAATWWDSTGPFWPLHRLNEVRVGYIRERLASGNGRDADTDLPLEGVRLLDVGCGGGILSESMAKMGADVVGVDVVERNVQVARLHAGGEGLSIDYRVTGMEALAEAGEAFDAVLNMEVVEHVADLPKFMGACSRVVRPGGLMFVATINRTALSWLVAIVGAEYILRWLPRGTHQWRRFPKPSEIEELLHTGGLQVTDETGVLMNPIKRRLRLSRTTQVNYMLVARKQERVA